MPDVFGYKKDQKVGGLISPSFVKLKIGPKGDVAVAQQISLRYTRDVKSVSVIGSQSVYMMPGVPSGQLQISRMVGADPVHAPFKTDDPCGTVDIQITADPKCGGTSNGTSGQFGTLNCTNCMLQEVGLQVSAQDVVVTDSATYMVGGVEV